MLRMRRRPRHPFGTCTSNARRGAPRGINPENVGVPQQIAEAAHVLRLHFIVQFGSKLADGTQVNRRELQFAQLARAQLYLR